MKIVIIEFSILLLFYGIGSISDDYSCLLTYLLTIDKFDYIQQSRTLFWQTCDIMKSCYKLTTYMLKPLRKFL